MATAGALHRVDRERSDGVDAEAVNVTQRRHRWRARSCFFEGGWRGVHTKDLRLPPGR
jgi:hypothetical protein